MNEYFLWSITGLSIVATVANLYKKRWCFYVWCFTSGTWMVVDFFHEIYAQSVLFAVYTGLAVWGIIKWRKES